MFNFFPVLFLFLCFSVLWALQWLHSGKRELILVLLDLLDLRSFGFVYFFFHFVSGKGCGSLIARRRFRPQTQWRPLHKTLTSGLGLDDMSLAWPVVVQLFVFIYFKCSRISHEYSSLFIVVINLIFIFSLWCIDWVGSLYANRIFMYFFIKSSIGTQGEVG